MKEIILLACFLGVLFSVLWLVVLGAERLLKRKRDVRFGGGTEEAVGGDDDGVRAAVVAAITAYEEGAGRRRMAGRVEHIRKEERISWWKKSERMR